MNDFPASFATYKPLWRILVFAGLASSAACDGATREPGAATEASQVPAPTGDATPGSSETIEPNTGEVPGPAATGTLTPTSPGSGTGLPLPTSPASTASGGAGGSPDVGVSPMTGSGGARDGETNGNPPNAGGATEPVTPGEPSDPEDPTTPEEPVTPATCPATYQNPIIWQDLPDLEVIRVDETYYYTASTFHHSPGAPILRSSDLVHWQYIGHSVPLLDFDPRYDMSGGHAYRNGIWASSLQYRPSNQTFYWLGCMHNVGGGYVFTATSPEGPWTKHSSQRCYYDVGLLIDDTDTMYAAYGNGTISVARLTEDGFGEVESQVVFETPENLTGPLEGSRFYQINGDYYIFVTQYANGEYVLRSTSGPFGPYELRPFAVSLPFAGSGAGASPHQGGIVETQNGDWYYLAFNDSYPGGRLPVMAPMTWNDGWPEVTLVGNQWGAEYPFPNLPCGASAVEPFPRTDTFSDAALSHEWEWNHNPDDSKWSSGAGLTLQTATVTNDLYAARNTLTRRTVGPVSTATIELDTSAMQDGDVAGLAALRDSSAWIGVRREGGASRVVVTSGLEMDTTTWNTTSTGMERASEEVSDTTIWLRVEANIRTDAGGGQARFSYSTDGTQFTPLGDAFTMKKDWQYFLGYRFGIFNYATETLGGSVRVARFVLDVP